MAIRKWSYWRPTRRWGVGRSHSWAFFVMLFPQCVGSFPTIWRTFPSFSFWDASMWQQGQHRTLHCGTSGCLLPAASCTPLSTYWRCSHGGRWRSFLLSWWILPWLCKCCLLSHYWKCEWCSPGLCPASMVCAFFLRQFSSVADWWRMWFSLYSLFCLLGAQVAVLYFSNV